MFPLNLGADLAKPAIDRQGARIALHLGATFLVVPYAVRLPRHCRLSTPSVVDRPMTCIGRQIEQRRGLRRQTIYCLRHGNHAFIFAFARPA